MNSDETQSKIFKALSHPARLAILKELRHDEQCVCHLESMLGYRQAYISQHLMVLRDAALVEDRRDGWNIFYRVIEPKVFAILDSAGAIANSALTEAASPDSSHSRKSARKTKACPCPKCNLDNANIRC